MKIQKLFLPILILSFIFSGTMVQAQSKNEKEKAQKEKILELEKRLEKALKMQEADLEKALKLSKQLQERELKSILENQHKIRQKAMDQHERQFEEKEGNYRRAYNLGKNYDKNVWSVVESEWDSDIDIEFDGDAFKAISLPNVYFSTGKERTALTIHKELEDVTFDTKFKYEVTEGSKGIHFSVSGEMEEGTLLVKLIKPNKEVLQEIEISPLANVGWDQDLRWEKDEEKAGNFGSWTIVVSAKGASGRYNVSVRAN